jgi:hypothetical protein
MATFHAMTGHAMMGMDQAGTGAEAIWALAAAAQRGQKPAA